MPYELAFTRVLAISDAEQYINECCIGGDVVLSQLLPAIQGRYPDAVAVQEDWGWFVWVDEGPQRLTVDVFCDDPAAGAYRIHLGARVRRFLGHKVADTPELDWLRETVAAGLTRWLGSPPLITQLDAKYNPLDDARRS